MPFLTLTLWSDRQTSDELRPLAAELLEELSEVGETTKGYLIGGQPRTLRVEPDPDRMNASGVSWLGLTGALASAAQRVPAGSSVRANREIQVLAGPLFERAADVGLVVAAVREGRPVYV